LPTLITRPREGFSRALSGRYKPPVVFSSSSSRSTTTRSLIGCNFVLVAFFGLVAVAVAIRDCLH